MTTSNDRPRRTTAADAEAALLGAALHAPRQAARLLADLTTGDLADPAHRAVLAAIRAVLANGAPPDPALVLAAYNRGQHHGAPAHLFAITVHDCLAAAGTPGAETHYRRAVLEARWRRDAITAATRIHHAAETAPLTDLHAVLAQTLAGLGATLARLTPTPTPKARPAGPASTHHPKTKAGTGTTPAPTNQPRTREAA